MDAVFNILVGIGGALAPSVLSVTETAASLFDLYTPSNAILVDPAAPPEFDILCCLPIAVLITILRYTIQYATTEVIRPFALKEDKEEKTTTDKAKEFSESFFKFIYYFTAYCMCCYILSLGDYWPNTANCWKGVILGQHRSPIFTAYYIWELSWYVSGLFCHLTLETRRKDHNAMLIHHLVTICLIVFSYVVGYHRIGILVLYCHDISDIFLEGAKIFRYVNLNMLSNITFVGLVASWAWSRLYLFPFRVIYSTLIEGPEVASVEMGMPTSPYWLIFNLWLSTLVVLHVYWFVIILSIALKTLGGKAIDDSREDGGPAKVPVVPTVVDKQPTKTKQDKQD